MFTKIKQVPSDFFEKVAFDSGVLVRNWDKTAPFTITDAMIIAATTGDFNISSTPSVIDLFEDVNGVPNGTKEGVYVESWEHTIGVTAINTSLDVIKIALGVADIDTTAGSVTPRLGLADQENDFVHLTWIGQTVDGGLIVADLNHALSTEGLQITTGKKTKGQFPLTIRGYYSIEDPDESPVNYYVIASEESGVTYTYAAVTPVGTENPSEEGWFVLIGDNYRATSDATVDDNVTYYVRSTTT